MTTTSFKCAHCKDTGFYYEHTGERWMGPEMITCDYCDAAFLPAPMKVVYIAHPISGDVAGNLEKIRLIVRELNLERNDIIPFAPYWIDCHALDDSQPAEREKGMKNGKYLLRKCVDEVWLYGDRISAGMQAEIDLAEMLDIPVFSKSSQIKFADSNIKFTLDF